MAFLKDVNVKLVSFVRKAANKRTFTLMKSADSDSDSIINEDNEKNNEVYKPMRKEVKAAILKMVNLFKSADSTVTPDNMVETLKSDDTLKLSENEIVEIADHVEMLKAGFPFVSPEEKKKKEAENKKKEEGNNLVMKTEEADELKKSHDALKEEIISLRKALTDITKASERQDVMLFLQKECAFLPEDVEKTAETILELSAVSPKMATAHKETLKKASAAIEQSNLFKEIGSSTDAILKSESEVEGFDLIKQFSTSLETIKKSADGKPISSDSIANLVKGFGPQYNAYREAHILRAKRNAI
jgi:hypothetical protein